MNKQKLLIEALTDVEAIDFYTNGLKKTIGQLETGDVVGIRLDMGIDPDTNIAYHIQGVGVVNGFSHHGGNEKEKSGLNLRIKNFKIDNYNLND